MLDFIVGGFSIEEFRKYYRSLSDLQEYYISIGSRQSGSFDLGTDEEQHIERDANHLITWIEEEQIVGHCIWHETSTEEMIPGDPRGEEDRKCLKQLFGGKKDNLVELHELWLKSDHRGKGYGHQVFSFFEDYVSKAGFDGIVYYTDHEGAVSLCRKRRYKEAFLENSGMFLFTLSFSID
ncbi:MAG: GNAT family N-acetyltransferase [Candidatus Thorarchaeota archaeon]